MDRRVVDLFGGPEAVERLHRGRILDEAAVQYEAEQLRDRRLSDQAMATLLGVALKTFRRAVRTDLGCMVCAVLIPRPKGKPLRRWRAWQLEARWSGAGVPGRRRPAP